MKRGRVNKTASVDFARLALPVFFFRFFQLSFFDLPVVPFFLLIDGLVQPVEEPALFLWV
jgi:hypothetical protein